MMDFCCAFAFQEPPVTVLNQVLALIGTTPQKLDLTLCNVPGNYFRSLRLHESQVRLDLLTSQKNTTDSSEIFGRKRAEELPLTIVFLLRNLTEMLDLLFHVQIPKFEFSYLISIWSFQSLFACLDSTVLRGESWPSGICVFLHYLPWESVGGRMEPGAILNVHSSISAFK